MNDLTVWSVNNPKAQLLGSKTEIRVFVPILIPWVKASEFFEEASANQHTAASDCRIVLRCIHCGVIGIEPEIYVPRLLIMSKNFAGVPNQSAIDWIGCREELFVSHYADVGRIVQCF